MRRTNKSGGRQPAVVGKPDAVRRPPFEIAHHSTTMRRTNKSGGRQPAVVPETHLQRRPTFPNPARSPRARSLSIPRLAYASRSWLPARMLLLMCVSYPQVRYPFPRLAHASRSWLPARMLLLTCVSYPQVRYPFPRLAYASRSWLHDIQRFDCRAYPPVTKLPEPFFHPNRIKTTTLYPTGRGAARTYSEKQSRYERAKKRGEFAGLLERIRRSNPTYEVHGSG
jgi:hypothetical protein